MDDELQTMLQCPVCKEVSHGCPTTTGRSDGRHTNNRAEIEAATVLRTNSMGYRVGSIELKAIRPEPKYEGVRSETYFTHKSSKQSRVDGLHRPCPAMTGVRR